MASMLNLPFAPRNFARSEGTFALKERPSVEMLSRLPNLRGKEAGIIYMDGLWVISLTRGLGTEFCEPISEVLGKGIFNMFGHSHPIDPRGKEGILGRCLPSGTLDEMTTENTRDGFAYIFSELGLVEFHRPTQISFCDTDRLIWKTREESGVGEKFRLSGGFEVLYRHLQSFYQTYFGLRIIPWNNSIEIENILNSKE